MTGLAANHPAVSREYPASIQQLSSGGFHVGKRQKLLLQSHHFKGTLDSLRHPNNRDSGLSAPLRA